MINWSFIERNYKDGYFKVTTEEQGMEFLKACEEHKLLWMGNEKPTEFTAWKGNIKSKGYVYFCLRTIEENQQSISYGSTLIGRYRTAHEFHEFSGDKAVCHNICAQLSEYCVRLYRATEKEFCEGKSCSQCELRSKHERNGRRCLTCQLDDVIKDIEKVLGAHEWSEDNPHVKEMTVAEISKALGYDVKIVKEDK